MYKILVIDDDWKDRKSSYESLFNESTGFSTIYLDIEANNFALIDDPTIDVIILDLYLIKGKASGVSSDAENYFREVLKFISNKKPVILCSRKFSELASWVSIPNEYDVKVVNYFGWPEIFNPSGTIKDNSLKETMLLRVTNSLNDYYKFTNSKKLPDETITIILLSDLQFGDPNFSEDTLLSEYNLARFLIEENIFADFVFILGDITYSGEPSQFDMAYCWIHNLCQKIFPKNFKAIPERIYVVPGNHDINLTLSTADKYEFDFEGYKSEHFLKERKNKLNDNKIFKFFPFCDFAFKLTKDKRWIEKANNLCWISDRFINWGLRMVTLNSVSEQTHTEPKKFEFNELALREVASNTETLSTNIYTVFLAHNGPDDLGYQLGLNSDKKVKNLFSLMNAIGCDIFLHGHRHVPSKKYEKPYKGRYTDKVEYIMVGTYNLNVVRKHDSRRSFSVLELNRNNSKIIDSKIRIFEIEEQTIKEII